MSSVIVFPLRWRDQPSGRRKRRRRKAEFYVFPHSRRRDDVERHARAMRGMSASDRGDYLTQVLDRVCSEMTALGIDCGDCQSDAIVELAEAVGRELHGPQFQIGRTAQ
jgi:hypothetical protein